jgi:hypothetical protein
MLLVLAITLEDIGSRSTRIQNRALNLLIQNYIVIYPFFHLAVRVSRLKATANEQPKIRS